MLKKAKADLLWFLRTKSVFYEGFVPSSAGGNSFYLDCKLTTLDPHGAWLVGEVVYMLIQAEAAAQNLRIDSLGGSTLGANPIALAVGMYSAQIDDEPSLQTFVVRQTAKIHAQTNRIEGNFNKGDTVVVVDDVLTQGESTIEAIDTIEKEGGTVAFVVVLVDRQEGGRQKLEALGHRVISAFQLYEIISQDSKSIHSTRCETVLSN